MTPARGGHTHSGQPEARPAGRAPFPRTLGDVRLGKYLASAGVASRRASEEIVRAGRVKVGEEVVTDPARPVDGSEDVTVDGAPLRPPSERVVFMVNKPTGVVSTARDPQGRPTVVALVDTPLRLYPVGRLDADTTGLLLLTNDGELAHRLTHPSFEVEKTYRAVVAGGPVRSHAIKALRGGVEARRRPYGARTGQANQPEHG